MQRWLRILALSFVLSLSFPLALAYHNDAVATTTGTLTLLSPAEGETFTTDSVTVSFLVEDLTIGSGGDHLHYYLDEDGVVMVYSTEDIALEGLSDGEHTFTLLVADAGHSDTTEEALTATVHFTVDTTVSTEETSYEEPPTRTATFVSPSDSHYTGTVPVEVEVSGTSVSTDFNHLHYYLDGTLLSMVYDTQPWELTELTDGEHTLTVVLATSDHTEYTDETLTDTVTFTFSAEAREPTFSDVPTTHDHYAAIEYLVSTGTLEGYADGTFLPEKTINRAELVKILVASQGIALDESTHQNCFPDVTTEWFAKYICYAESEGWVSGYPDGTFLPGKTVNKVEALKMAVNAFGLTDTLPTTVTETLFDDTDASAWYAPYVWVAKSMGLLEVTSGDYGPGDDMSRGLASEYVFRAWVVETMGVEAYDTETQAQFFEQADFSL